MKYREVRIETQAVKALKEFERQHPIGGNAAELNWYQSNFQLRMSGDGLNEVNDWLNGAMVYCKWVTSDARNLSDDIPLKHTIYVAIKMDGDNLKLMRLIVADCGVWNELYSQDYYDVELGDEISFTKLKTICSRSVVQVV